jgi:hypothetical protein
MFKLFQSFKPVKSFEDKDSKSEEVAAKNARDAKETEKNRFSTLNFEP